MTVLLTGAGLLFLSFCVQLTFWRFHVPERQIRALVIIFAIVPLIAACALQIADVPKALVKLSAAETIRLVIFYVSCGLMYIILYSAIEEQSPTLAIISYMAARSRCSGADLADRFGKGRELSHRIDLLARSEFVIQEGERYRLAPAGHRFAKFFDAASRLFGLDSGG